MNTSNIIVRKNRLTNRRRLSKSLIYLGVIIMCVWAAFPLYWMISVSLRERVYVYDPTVWLFMPTLENFITVFSERNLLRYIQNSAIVAVSTTAIALVIGTLAAYGFSRFKFRMNAIFLFVLLGIRMMPSIAIVIPMFVLATFANLQDTRIMLIVAYLLFNVPFTVWMMKGFFDEIPKELEEAAMVDGCTSLQSLYRVILPVARPGMVATAIFCIINSWNEFVFALFLTSVNAVTTPTIVQMFLATTGTVWGEMSAVGVVAIIPVLVFAMIVQKHMIRGLSFGAVKG